MVSGNAGVSQDGYRRELEQEIGRLHMKTKSLEGLLIKSEQYRDEDNIRFQENEKNRAFELEQSQKLIDSLTKDLDEALKRADVSDVGADTPNPFPTIKQMDDALTEESYQDIRLKSKVMQDLESGKLNANDYQWDTVAKRNPI